MHPFTALVIDVFSNLKKYIGLWRVLVSSEAEKPMYMCLFSQIKFGNDFVVLLRIRLAKKI